MGQLQEISEQKLALVLLNEKQYERKLVDTIKIDKKSTKMCYVCLNKPHTDTVQELDGMGLNIKFFFVDVLSRYKKANPLPNCVFMEHFYKLSNIQKIIGQTVSKHNCSYILFDTISSVPMYGQAHEIVKSTHKLTIGKNNQNINKVFTVLKEESDAQQHSESLAKDRNVCK